MSSLDWDRNINFDYITENPEYKDKYAFAVINNERGQVQRKQAKGWVVWDKEVDGYQDVWSPEGKSAAKKESDESMVARVPVGMGSHGPCEAILMYMPREMYEERVLAVHRQNAGAQIGAITESHKEKAAQSDMGRFTATEGKLTTSIAPEPGSDVNVGNS